ncbi:MAG: tetraacyldisaccharide 4'-kinase [Proteobacteria bacterium]|nr:tetraacyldisaccharide 4'-kinase [Pseudomonadota bacterium]
MRTPSFWYQKFSPFGWLLAPLGWLYGGIGKFLRRRITAQKISIPVICVGNITLGGAGKTPVVNELAQRLQSQGVKVHILSRGYGGTELGPFYVDPKKHSAAQVGDEPLLLAEIAPTWVAANKVRGALSAQAAGAQMLILDDGLQNLALYKDISLLVMDGQHALGNGQIFPAGPLRENLSDALRRVDAVVWIGGGTPPAKITQSGKLMLRAKTETTCDHHLKARAVFAFCGLGLPQKFFNSLQAQGAVLLGTRSFADHHPYTVADIESLLKEAGRLSALPVTTAKDAARIPAEFLSHLTVCDLRLIWEDEKPLEALLKTLTTGIS